MSAMTSEMSTGGTSERILSAMTRKTLQMGPNSAARASRTNNKFSDSSGDD